MKYTTFVGAFVHILIVIPSNDDFILKKWILINTRGKTLR